MVMVDIMLCDEIYKLINVYLPNDIQERKNMIEELSLLAGTKNIILGGDFNFVENFKLDKIGSEDFGNQGYQEMKRLKNAFQLVDVFRQKYPQVTEFTWSNGSSHCRLDRFYISKHLCNFVLKIGHLFCMKSDHLGVELRLHNLFEKIKKGPGYWHCNVSFLEDPILKGEMEALWYKLNMAI